MILIKSDEELGIKLEPEQLCRAKGRKVFHIGQFINDHISTNFSEEYDDPFENCHKCEILKKLL